MVGQVRSEPHYCHVSLTLCLHSALMKQASTGSHKETEKKAAVKHVAAEQKTSHRSQAHLLAGAVKRRRYSLFIYDHNALNTRLMTQQG